MARDSSVATLARLDWRMKLDGQDAVVVGLGEAVFDRFVEHDRTILGGAPLNMAFHAHQILSLFGGHGTVLSRVGRDGLGDQVVSELQSAGLPTGNIQRDANHATGDVVVTVDECNENHYSITPNVAWDHIEFDDSAAELAAICSAVCFGTLAQRSAQSRAAIHEFLAATDALIICDVNLRQDFYSAETLRSSLTVAGVVKLNEEELKVVSRELNLAADTENDLASVLLNAFNLELIALT
ncbi:MAG: PfkB family carbohydrate kinase, partial [Planctomycetota bacterium]